ncbi:MULTISPECIES: DUF2938 domain-containing protein [unclassified Vibrio]|uniref:DUF2938 domain-containing protein n=1 Tax=Vibrio sp. HB236076 TaxID=3232307 RepID=A0AB39HIP0_9VIBR|nr:DUF2938 domain-containing protein [Vibrio sp. HB161653]MDP5252867.1 DUF2938 domain-containing protein [Vibrio sp. HB161653]
MGHLFFVILIGIGATAVMDLWGAIRKRLLNIAPTNWAMVGRWVGHLGQGQFRHTAIAQSPPIRFERFIGWTAHYVTGVAYAALLVMICGSTWITAPSIGPALAFGIATVVAPFFLLQPGMGAGVAGSRTPNPNAIRLHSVINHAVFGCGLFLSALALQWVPV